MKDPQLKKYIEYLIQLATDIQARGNIGKDDIHIIEIELDKFKYLSNNEESILPSIREKINEVVLHKKYNPQKSKFMRIVEIILRSSKYDSDFYSRRQRDMMDIINDFKSQLYKLLLEVDTDNLFSKVDYR